MISKKLFLAAVLIAGLTAAPRAAGACSCTGEVSFAQAVSSSQEIYIGTVVDVRSAAPEYPYMVWARLAVSQHWKGSPGDTASVLTGENSAICGLDFVPGEDYLVYAQAYSSQGDLFTHLCSRSHHTWEGDPDPSALDASTPVVRRSWGALKLYYR